MDKFGYLVVSLVALGLFLAQQATVVGGTEVKGVVGAIIDDTSRAGKEAKVAMEMAIDDFNRDTNQTLLLHITNSQTIPVQAALSARELVDTHKVQAIVGPHTWEEGWVVADIGSQAHIPILSLADSSPEWATQRWPFLVQASPSQYTQMKAIAAIIQSLGWNRVSFIYQNFDSTSNETTLHLSRALQDVGAEISHTIALQPFDSLPEQLEKLKRDQCRVFVVHTSLALGVRLFRNANKMGMMEKGYVWITTNTIADLVHSINASTISSLFMQQGILGVRSYFAKSNNVTMFQDFNERFRGKFIMEHPEEENNEPGIFAVQAYDATRVVALALNETNMGTIGRPLLDRVVLVELNGLSGKIQFTKRKLAASNVFQIVNVSGKRYGKLGFWSDGKGFSETIDDKATYSSFMQNFGQVFPPRRQLHSQGQGGWTLPTNANPLKVAVPTESLYKQLVNPDFQLKSSYTGFSIEVFKETVKMLPYDLPYEFFRFEGSYDDMVEQVYNGEYGAIAGDVTILARRYQRADFTQPYTEAGLEMIVPVQSKLPNNAWLFMKPFTKAMWALILAITIYNGFVIWLIERNHCPELRGSALNQIGTLLWLAFSTLFSLHGEKLHSNLSRMAMVMWLFVALVVTQSYTASLTSMLTAQRLEPKVKDIDTLKKNNATVGYCRGSYIDGYLRDVLGFNNTKNYATPEEHARALRSGEIGAVFLGGPVAKIFLAMYCKNFVRAGPTFKVGGLGFVFPKGSPLLPDINEALSNVSESGKVQELEDLFIGSQKCVDVEPNYDEYSSLSLNSFWVLFVLTGGTSTVALMIYAIVGMWKHRTRRLSRRVSHAESPTSFSSTLDSWSQV